MQCPLEHPRPCENAECPRPLGAEPQGEENAQGASLLRREWPERRPGSVLSCVTWRNRTPSLSSVCLPPGIWPTWVELGEGSATPEVLSHIGRDTDTLLTWLNETTEAPSPIPKTSNLVCTSQIRPHLLGQL